MCQGSVLSLSLFNVSMNIFVECIRNMNVGCCMRSMFVGCLLYADDIILICPSVSGLQIKLDLCADVGEELSLKFNPNKSHCVAIDKLARSVHDQIILDSVPIQWISSFRYLGDYSGK